MKTCSKCKETKEYSQFNKNKVKKDGYECQCKQCRRNYYNKLKNDDLLKLKKEIRSTIIMENKLLLKDNKHLCHDCKKPFLMLDLSNGICTKCRKKNIHFIYDKEKSKEYRENNKKSISAKQKRWRDKNRESEIERCKQYRLKKKLEKLQQN